MKTLKAILAFFLGTFFLYSNGFAQTGSTSADQIIGMYWSPSKDAKIEIYKEADNIPENQFGWLIPGKIIIILTLP